MGALDTDNRVMLRLAIVVSVDPDTYTVSAQFVSNEGPTEEVILGGPYVSLRGPGWMGALPEKGDMALLAKPHRSESWIVISYVPYPETSSLEGDDENDDVFPRNRFRGSRPLLQSGELGVFGPSGGHLLIRRDGNVEIQASPLCMTSFFKDDHTIKTVCQNFIIEGFFGTSRFWTHRDEARDLNDATPTGYELQLKSLAQHAPHIFLDAGAIMEEERLLMPGYPPLSKNAFGLGACLRLMIFEQNFADNQANAGINPPDVRQARTTVRMSPSGDIEILSKGHVFMEARDRTSAVYGRELVVSHSTTHKTTEGPYTVNSESSVHITSKRKMELLAWGDMMQRSKNYFVRANSGDFKFEGKCKWNVTGNWFQEVGGHGAISYTGGLAVQCSESMGTSVGGRYSLRVTGQDCIENLGRDVVSHRTVLNNGKYQVEVASGGLELRVGTKGFLPGSYLHMHNNKLTNPPYVGRIEMVTAYGAGSRFILDPTGGWQLAGLGGTLGSIHADALGNIQLGPVVGAAGYVVTSMSHRCYVTGLPPAGNPHVSATQLGPGLPFPAGLVAPPLPPIPRPEEPTAT
jgi:hypothetical protein